MLSSDIHLISCKFSSSYILDRGGQGWQLQRLQCFFTAATSAIAAADMADWYISCRQIYMLALFIRFAGGSLKVYLVPFVPVPHTIVNCAVCVCRLQAR